MLVEVANYWLAESENLGCGSCYGLESLLS